MSDESGWVDRINRHLAGTIHEQLRALVEQGQEGLSRFSAAAAEQGALLADAHQRMVETQRAIEGQLTGRVGGLVERLERLEEMVASHARRHDQAAPGGEDTSGIEARAAQRLVEMLSRAFAWLHENGSSNGETHSTLHAL